MSSPDRPAFVSVPNYNSGMEDKFPGDVLYFNPQETGHEEDKAKSISENRQWSDITILDGKYFKVVEVRDMNVDALCQMCLPNEKIVKGRLQSSSNFLKHMKSNHPQMVAEYNAYRAAKKSALKEAVNEEMSCNQEEMTIEEPCVRAESDLLQENNINSSSEIKQECLSDYSGGLEDCPTVSYNIDEYPSYLEATLDEKYKIINIVDNKFIEAQCQMCLPKLKIIRGCVQSSANYLKHMKKTHPNKMAEYQEYKLHIKVNKENTKPESAQLSSDLKHSEPTQSIEDLNPNEVQTILDGRYFKIIKIHSTTCVEAECQLCLPASRVLRGNLLSSSNFIKHMKTFHLDKIPEYNQYKAQRRNSRKRKIGSTSTSCEDREISQGKLLKPLDDASLDGNIFKILSKDQNIHAEDKKATDELVDDFHDRLSKFIINTLMPVSILDNHTFINLFQGTNLSVPTQEMMMDSLANVLHIQINGIKSKITQSNFFCNAVNVWSNLQVSFLGVSIHFIDEELKRYSAVLACKRFKQPYDQKSIYEMLENVKLKFGIAQGNIVSSVTVIDYADVDFGDSESRFRLINLERCGSDILNEIATLDYKCGLEADDILKDKHKTALEKCMHLWRELKNPKSADSVREILGFSLTPCIPSKFTSLHKAVSQILQEIPKLPAIFERLSLNYFTEIELLYLEEYFTVLKPLADTVNLLQNNNYYGYLLPSLLSLRVKYEKMKSQVQFKCGGEELLGIVLSSLQRRFADFYDLSREEAIISAALLPNFKLRWYNAVRNPTQTIDDIKKLIVTKSEEVIDTLDDIDTDDQDSSDSCDEFFDFGENFDRQIQI